MATALFINGIFRTVLEAIISAGKRRPRAVYYLQPYSGKKIKLLSESPPSEGSPVPLYVSTTDALGMISYTAQIVGWEDKRRVPEQRLELLNQHIRKWQPKEERVYARSPGGKECVNLISIVAIRKLESPVAVSCMMKVKEGTPCRPRTRAGGWVYVSELPEWLGTVQTYVKEQFEDEFAKRLRESFDGGDLARRKRLAAASRSPEKVQVVSVSYRRNADVVVEVLRRANGTCEQCKQLAPFVRASDGSPYLEIHHGRPLADGGDDTVDNVTALCPNCHRERHFGVSSRRADTQSGIG